MAIKVAACPHSEPDPSLVFAAHHREYDKLLFFIGFALSLVRAVWAASIAYCGVESLVQFASLGHLDHVSRGACDESDRLHFQTDANLHLSESLVSAVFQLFAFVVLTWWDCWYAERRTYVMAILRLIEPFRILLTVVFHPHHLPWKVLSASKHHWGLLPLFWRSIVYLVPMQPHVTISILDHSLLLWVVVQVGWRDLAWNTTRRIIAANLIVGMGAAAVVCCLQQRFRWCFGIHRHLDAQAGGHIAKQAFMSTSWSGRTSTIPSKHEADFQALPIQSASCSGGSGEEDSCSALSWICDNGYDIGQDSGQCIDRNACMLAKDMNRVSVERCDRNTLEDCFSKTACKDCPFNECTEELGGRKTAGSVGTQANCHSPVSEDGISLYMIEADCPWNWQASSTASSSASSMSTSWKTICDCNSPCDILSSAFTGEMHDAETAQLGWGDTAAGALVMNRVVSLSDSMNVRKADTHSVPRIPDPRVLEPQMLQPTALLRRRHNSGSAACAMSACTLPPISAPALPVQSEPVVAFPRHDPDETGAWLSDSMNTGSELLAWPEGEWGCVGVADLEASANLLKAMDMSSPTPVFRPPTCGLFNNVASSDPGAPGWLATQYGQLQAAELQIADSDAELKCGQTGLFQSLGSAIPPSSCMPAQPRTSQPCPPVIQLALSPSLMPMQHVVPPYTPASSLGVSPSCLPGQSTSPTPSQITHLALSPSFLPHKPVPLHQSQQLDHPAVCPISRSKLNNCTETQGFSIIGESVESRHVPGCVGSAFDSGVLPILPQVSAALAAVALSEAAECQTECRTENASTPGAPGAVCDTIMSKLLFKPAFSSHHTLEQSRDQVAASRTIAASGGSRLVMKLTPSVTSIEPLNEMGITEITPRAFSPVPSQPAISYSEPLARPGLASRLTELQRRVFLRRPSYPPIQSEPVLSRHMSLHRRSSGGRRSPSIQDHSAHQLCSNLAQFPLALSPHWRSTSKFVIQGLHQSHVVAAPAYLAPLQAKHVLNKFGTMLNDGAADCGMLDDAVRVADFIPVNAGKLHPAQGSPSPAHFKMLSASESALVQLWLLQLQERVPNGNQSLLYQSPLQTSCVTAQMQHPLRKGAKTVSVLTNTAQFILENMPSTMALCWVHTVYVYAQGQVFLLAHHSKPSLEDPCSSSICSSILSSALVESGAVPATSKVQLNSSDSTSFPFQTAATGSLLKHAGIMDDLAQACSCGTTPYDGSFSLNATGTSELEKQHTQLPCCSFTLPSACSALQTSCCIKNAAPLRVAHSQAFEISHDTGGPICHMPPPKTAVWVWPPAVPAGRASVLEIGLCIDSIEGMHLALPALRHDCPAACNTAQDVRGEASPGAVSSPHYLRVLVTSRNDIILDVDLMIDANKKTLRAGLPALQGCSTVDVWVLSAGKAAPCVYGCTPLLVLQDQADCNEVIALYHAMVQEHALSAAKSCGQSCLSSNFPSSYKNKAGPVDEVAALGDMEIPDCVPVVLCSSLRMRSTPATPRSSPDDVDMLHASTTYQSTADPDGCHTIACKHVWVHYFVPLLHDLSIAMSLVGAVSHGGQARSLGRVDLHALVIVVQNLLDLLCRQRMWGLLKAVLCRMRYMAPALICGIGLSKPVKQEGAGAVPGFCRDFINALCSSGQAS